MPHDSGSSGHRWWIWIAVVTILAGGSTIIAAQDAAQDATQEAKTRAEEIELARNQKAATLWPEREDPLVIRANRLLDRGLLEGIQNGEGNNGWQFLLSGTRDAQGQTFGIGYRRADLFHDALTARATVRGTLRGAFMVDGDAEFKGLRRSPDTFVVFHTKYEHSPRMDYYGLGADSHQQDRTLFVLNTLSADVRAGYRFTRSFNAGVSLTGGGVHTGPTSDDSVPSIETIFNATTAPGLFDDAAFLGWGGFAGFDTRDVVRGPRRGGFYGINFNRFVDLSGGRYTHRQLEVEGQQFIPYFNETRVVAIFARARFAYTGQDDRVVPFYFQPTLGGNFDLRGFGNYRFHDNNAFSATVEHRWYVFTGLEMAVFLDGGETVPEKGAVAFSKIDYSGGIGFRARVTDAVVLRFDVARSHEGFRWIWSMSDVSLRRF